MFIDVGLREGPDRINNVPECRPHEKSGDVTHGLAVLRSCSAVVNGSWHLSVAAASIAALATSGLSAATVCRNSRANRSLSAGGSAGRSLTAERATSTTVFGCMSGPDASARFASLSPGTVPAITIFLKRAISRHRRQQKCRCAARAVLAERRRCDDQTRSGNGQPGTPVSRSGRSLAVVGAAAAWMVDTELRAR